MDFRQIRLFCFDMDGTIYLDRTPIPGAIELLTLLQERSIPFIYLTNNSSKSVKDYMKKLQEIGFPATEENFYTSGQAAGVYLTAHFPGVPCYVMGTDSLKSELKTYGVDVREEVSPEIGVFLAGYDTQLTYQKLTDACELLRRDVPFLATNPDWVCPMGKDEYLPDCGLMCQMLEVSTGKKPKFIGKPEPDMILQLLDRFGVEKDACCMVGDRMYTDIASGLNAGVKTVCVLSGEVTKEEVLAAERQPDLLLDSVKDIYLALTDKQ